MRLHSIDFSSKIYTNDMTILNQSKSNREGNTHTHIHMHTKRNETLAWSMYSISFIVFSLSLLYSPSFAFMYVSRGTMQHIRIKKNRTCTHNLETVVERGSVHIETNKHTSYMFISRKNFQIIEKENRNIFLIFI